MVIFFSEIIYVRNCIVLTLCLKAKKLKLRPLCQSQGMITVMAKMVAAVRWGARIIAWTLPPLNQVTSV